MKIKDKARIKKILFITLSNIGDIILTTPALAVLRREFPSATIDVLSGPNGNEIFFGHPLVSNFIVYDKFADLNSKRQLIGQLRRNRYDLIVDLRKSLFPILIGSKYRTAIIRRRGVGGMHKKEEHLLKLKELGLDISDAPFSFYIGEEDGASVNNILTSLNAKMDFVVVSPGAKSHIKRWTKEGFALICDRLISELGMDVIMVGDGQDKGVISEISALMKNRPVVLASKLTLRELGALIARSRLLISNDSAPMHIGYALGRKVLAIFGPTDPKRYGPLGRGSAIIRKELACSPCEIAQCKARHECMNLISADEVFDTVKKMLKDS